MNEAALIRHDIYGKLTRLSEAELHSVADFIDFVQHKNQRLQKKKIIKLQGVLAGYDLDVSNLKKIREETWRHLDGEFKDE
jgi:hypothetical protein